MLPPDFDRDHFISQLREKHARILLADIVFAVENGWLPLIADGLAQIEKVLERHSFIGRGQVKQIKEKLGDLRIYVRPRRESYRFTKALAADLMAISDQTIRKSLKTCELCGDPGELGNFDGYYQTLCTKHADQRLKWIANGRNGDPFHD
ncbi:hypothetical protein Kim5_CH02884 [Rhizobium sp. Kim5]|uniref:hypothetical protein n=1 Tax=Rhizobium sp. Kim5 TaxID=2020311 RepID=UPI000A2A003B|nr:hypothetical protein [Rhizobium sp. Kim5]ARQ58927.1 hypothetical protein Kim5_CH02884 [Rhizobium sp. Kim5]